MKKILIVLGLLTMLPCVAADWAEMGYKAYIDLSSYQRQGDSAEAWVKLLNQNNSLGKSVWYVKSRMSINCERRTYTSGRQYVYDKAENQITTLPGMYGEIIPDTAGEDYYRAFCNMRSTEGEYNE